jgi:hypothetical protein
MGGATRPDDVGAGDARRAIPTGPISPRRGPRQLVGGEPGGVDADDHIVPAGNRVWGIGHPHRSVRTPAVRDQIRLVRAVGQ